MYDAIVVGSRVAGAATAMLLARKGYTVLLVDKAHFPSDTLSGHYLHVAGASYLGDWGLLDRLHMTGCPPLRGVRFDFGPFVLVGAPPAAGNGVDVAYAPRRTIFDQLLIDAAVEAGVEFRQGYAVAGVLSDGDHVTGIRSESRSGAISEETAKIVIGADGMRSVIAQAVMAPAYHQKAALTCAYYTYWEGVPIGGTELYIRDRCTVVAYPTHDGLACVTAVFPISDFARVRTAVEANYLRAVDMAPVLADRIHEGKRADRFHGTGDLPNFFRKPYGNGWALAGDAGYHKDPLTAQGMTDAFRDAELLSTAIDEGFSGRRALAEALAEYETRRNEACNALYEFTLKRATQEPPQPEMVRLLMTLEGNQRQIDRFIGIDAGTVRYEDFFGPHNIAEIMSHAARAHGIGNSALSVPI